MLMVLKVFREIYIGFLLIGHTHEDKRIFQLIVQIAQNNKHVCSC